MISSPHACRARFLPTGLSALPCTAFYRLKKLLEHFVRAQLKRQSSGFLYKIKVFFFVGGGGVVFESRTMLQRNRPLGRKIGIISGRVRYLLPVSS